MAREGERISDLVIAAVFDRVAVLLEEQGANAYRIRAYRDAAEELRARRPGCASLLAEGGQAALVALPHIGDRLASTIDELLHSGSLALLQRLEGSHAPGDLFENIPGIGAELAHRIHVELEIDTLEELEAAAEDGRLIAVDGVGEHRLGQIKSYVAEALDRSPRRRGERAASPPQAASRPTVAEILELDKKYRDLAARGKLERIAPVRHNPRQEKWLPVWHPRLSDFDWTVLYSNSALAHRLGKTRDWVVLYFEDKGVEEQCTVVTEYRGKLSGRRVVRGRERECAEYYASEQVTDDVRDWVHHQAEELD